MTENIVGFASRPTRVGLPLLASQGIPYLYNTGMKVFPKLKQFPNISLYDFLRYFWKNVAYMFDIFNSNKTAWQEKIKQYSMIHRYKF